MADGGSERDVRLSQFAEEFAARTRRGERPFLQYYLDHYPDLADVIREVFPTLALIENVGGGRPTAPCSPRACRRVT